MGCQEPMSRLMWCGRCSEARRVEVARPNRDLALFYWLPVPAHPILKAIIEIS
jgi:hypothetical protein